MKKHKSNTTKVEAVHQKNPIAIASLKRDEVKSRHGYRGTWSLKSVVFHVATTLNFFTTSKDVGLDVKEKVVNVTYATIMEK